MDIKFRPAQVLFLALAAIIAVSGYFLWKYAFFTEPAPKTYKIGFLLNEKSTFLDDNLNGFKAGMKDLGYQENVNIEYISKNAGGDNKLFVIYGKELNAAGVDLFIMNSTTVVEEWLKITEINKPGVFVSVGRPGAIVKNLTAPEGRITGFGEGTTVEFSGKRLEFLKEVAPKIKKVVSIVEKSHGNTPLFKERIAATAKTLGMEAVFIEIAKPEDLPGKLPLLKNFGDSYIACPCVSNARFAKEMVAQFNKDKIPSISANIASGPNVGFLLAYSDDRFKTGLKSAAMVDKILKGDPLSSIPVEFATDVVLEINLKTAREIGLVIPEKILLRADKIYQE